MLLLDKEDEHLRESAHQDLDGYWRHGSGKMIHKMIMPCEYPLVCDHRNRNVSDNRRCNLRSVTQMVNAINSIARTDRYPGVRCRGPRTPFDYRVTTSGAKIHNTIVTGMVEAIMYKREHERERYGENWVDYEGNLTKEWAAALTEAIRRES